MRKRVHMPVGTPKRGRFARPQGGLRLRFEGHPGKGDEQQHDRDVDDIAAVATTVAGQQLEKRDDQRLPVLPMPGSRAARKFLDDGRQHEPADTERDQRADVPHTRHQQNEQRENAARERHGELAAQIGQRGAAPGDQRADPGHREQRETERHVDLIEEGRADRDLRALDRLGENRKQRAPEHGEGDTDEQQIVEEKAGLTAHHRLEGGFGLEQRQPVHVQDSTGDRGHKEEAEEEVADARLRERVHARDHARARDERAKNRQQPCAKNQCEVPLLQHPPLFLDHDRMEERRHHQPRQ